MTVEQFRESLCRDEPPSGLDFALAGLWWDAKGDWAKAHESAQEGKGPAGSWVHAYLHRKEGDAPNAGYWYQRAGRTPCRITLQEEWLEIVESLLSRAGSKTSSELACYSTYHGGDLDEGFTIP